MTKILIIENDSLIREELFAWLSSEGFEVFSAEDGISGIQAALHHLPDLIVCAIVIPRLDGYGVLLELRANLITVGIPFIFVTMRAAPGDIRKGMAAGADDYISKPFTRSDLLQAVQARLRKKSMQDQAIKQEIEQLHQALTEERELRLLKGKFAAMFSHDFRNPLTTILSSNTLLVDYADRMDEARRSLHHHRINASVRQLVRMLDDLLLTMQMETGNLTFKPVSIDAEQFFQTIVAEFQALYSDTHRINFESHLSTPLLADPRLLRSIAANLISNAIKYSPQEGEIRVRVDSSDEQFTLTVQDHGLGIPAEDQARLFTAFQRGSNVGSVEGTGLGLAIVKQAVDLHGGSIHFESQVNVGTRMIVTLPIRPTDAGALDAP